MHPDGMLPVHVGTGFVISLGPGETVMGYIQSQGDDNS